MSIPVRLHDIAWTPEQVARLWDYYAAHRLDAYFARHYGDAVLRASGLDLSRPLDVVDFGCGPGFMWDHVREATAWRYTGLDFSPNSIAALGARAAGHPRYAGAYGVDSLPSPLAEGAYDAVLLLEVVEHLNDEHLDATLREVFRLLKPGGIALVSTPNDEDLADCRKLCPECGALFHEWQHVRSWNEASLGSELARHGLLQVHVLATDIATHGRSAASLGRRVARAAKRLLGKRAAPANLLGTYRKA